MYRYSLMFFILWSHAVQAVYDLAAIDIRPQGDEISFCFQLEPDVDNMRRKQPPNDEFYLGTQIQNQLFYVSLQDANQTELQPFDLNNDPKHLQKYRSTQTKPAKVCSQPFAKTMLKNLPLYAGVGQSFDDIVTNQKYRQIFNPNTPPYPTTSKSWTIMVYMIGSDLESRGQWASKNILEMLNASQQIPPESVNIILTTGASTRTGWQTTKRLWLHQGQQYVLEDLGTTALTEPQTLVDFVTWADKNFPAEHQALVLWGHGAGTNGFGHQSVNDTSTSLDLTELNQSYQTLRETLGHPLDLVIYDACLMGTIEVAQVTSQIASMMTASVELEPSHGLDYQSFITQLGNNNIQTPLALAEFIETQYQQKSQAKPKGKPITYSVYDLTQLSQFNPLFETFSQQLQSILNQATYDNYTVFSQGMIRSPAYPSKESGGFLPDLDKNHIRIDLYSFLKNIANDFPDFKSSANQLLQILQKMVVSYSANLSHLETDAGRISVNIGNETGYLTELPTAFLAFNQAMQYYNQRKKNDAYRPQIELVLELCPAGVTCAEIPNWLELSADDNILQVDVYFGRLQADKRIQLHSQANLYQYTQPISEEVKLLIDNKDVCQYQICTDETQCLDAMVKQQDNLLLSEIELNQTPALLSFCPQDNGDWLSCGVTKKIGDIWGREDYLYFEDKITPIQSFYTQQKLSQQATDDSLIVQASQSVFLRKTCDLNQAAIVTGSSSLNGQMRYEKICDNQNCERAGVYIRP